MADDRQPEGKLIPGSPSPSEEESLTRLAAARTWKAYIELDVKECYFFAAPNRQRQISSMTMPSTQRMQDAPELNTDLAFILCQDFVTTVVNAFMPEAEPWCFRGPGMFVPGGKNGNVWKSIEKQVKEDDATIFDAMKASNLYPEITKAFYPDLAIGTVGLWIDRPHPNFPIVNSAIPLRELEINLGPYGEIDDRFAVRYTRNSFVRSLVGEEIWAKMPTNLRKQIEGAPTERTQVIWGFWRDWDDRTDEVWQHVVLAGEKMVHDKKLMGEGSCPLLVMRFNPTSDWPHGNGPLIQGLPTLRQVDELERMRIEHSSRSINPSITYPDDSFTNVEQGVEEGMAYPIRPGTEGAVKPIYIPPSPEVANYQFEEKIKVLRKLFFIDHPEQPGDTPPTATQWMDELARAQRRIGTPGLPFWREGPAQIFLRFKHLLELAGAIRPLQVDGRAVATLPLNPAQAAAEQQEVVKTMQVSTYLAQTFPEEFKVKIDGGQTMENIIAKSRLTDMFAYRKKEDVATAVEQMSKLIGDRPVPGQTNQVPGPAA